MFWGTLLRDVMMVMITFNLSLILPKKEIMGALLGYLHGLHGLLLGALLFSVGCSFLPTYWSSSSSSFSEVQKYVSGCKQTLRHQSMKKIQKRCAISCLRTALICLWSRWEAGDKSTSRRIVLFSINHSIRCEREASAVTRERPFHSHIVSN